MYYFSKEEGYVLCEDDLGYEERRDSVHTCCTVRCIAHHHHHHIDGTYRKLEEKAQLKEVALKQAVKMVEEGK
jgi:hypothetical protein